MKRRDNSQSEAITSNERRSNAAGRFRSSVAIPKPFICGAVPVQYIFVGNCHLTFHFRRSHVVLAATSAVGITHFSDTKEIVMRTANAQETKNGTSTAPKVIELGRVTEETKGLPIVHQEGMGFPGPNP